MIQDRTYIHKAHISSHGNLTSHLGVLPSALIVYGQGVIEVKVHKKESDFSITIQSKLPSKVEGNNKKVTSISLQFKVSKDYVLIKDNQGKVYMECRKKEATLDADPNCVYWFSIDQHNRMLRYGKGEVRLETQLASATIAEITKEKDANPDWLNFLGPIKYVNVKESKVDRDPLTVPLPLLVKDSDEITMDMAALHSIVVPESLAPEALRLYKNIKGKKFQLNTPEFPDFTDAIEASIRDPGGWCNNKLNEKSKEFGATNIKATYLRITLGVNQGESPGVPYVLEIWPPGHYSPIHNHAGAHAVIRVLYGSITVSLYSMLSIYHEKPFLTKNLGKDCITWISPRLNQTHKLHNTNIDGPTCMTIQCYAYGSLKDRSHYEYFDYISSSSEVGEIKHFTPNSDMDFIEFKNLMYQENIKRKLLK